MKKEVVTYVDYFGEETELELTDEFNIALEILRETNQNLFITGKAGSGKSTLLNYFASTTEKSIAVLAFTGLAAINVYGETIHSFFNFPLGFLEEARIGKNKKIADKINSIDVIVIDEISMVRADLIDAIDKSLRINRDATLPFGGIQMVFIGDLYQLPPVIDNEVKDIYYKFYETPYFFSGDVFKFYKMPYINLEKIHRQKDNKFIEILNTIRERKINLYSAIELLNKDNILYGKTSLVNEMVNNETICLTTTNKKSKEINDYFLSKLKTKIFKYKSSVTGKYDKKEYPTDETLNLKVGSKVMFIRNDQHKRYVNGDVGFITYLDKNKIVINKNDLDIVVKKATWEKTKYDYVSSDKKGERGSINKKIIGTFSQFPLKLAWSITIHKSQGQTYNRVFIDFHYGTFTSGQAYVALSRCRNLDGLMMKREMLVTDVQLDENISMFYDMFKNILEEKIE